MEAALEKQGLDLKQMPAEEKEMHWQAAKQVCAQKNT